MGKEKELLKEILANTQRIMKHLKIEVLEKAQPKKETRSLPKKVAVKKDKPKG